MLAERAVERPRNIRDRIQQCAVQIEQNAAKRAALPESRTLSLCHGRTMPEIDHGAYRGACFPRDPSPTHWDRMPRRRWFDFSSAGGRAADMARAAPVTN